MSGMSESFMVELKSGIQLHIIYTGEELIFAYDNWRLAVKNAERQIYKRLRDDLKSQPTEFRASIEAFKLGLKNKSKTFGESKNFPSIDTDIDCCYCEYIGKDYSFELDVNLPGDFTVFCKNCDFWHAGLILKCSDCEKNQVFLQNNVVRKSSKECLNCGKEEMIA